MSDGHLGKCKECTKADAMKNRLANLERCQEYDRQRGRTEARKARARAYQKTEQGKQKANEAKRRWTERNKVKRACHIITGNAIRDGKLVKAVICDNCGCQKDRIEAHHDDYSKPLEVKWLCRDCHAKHHRKYK